MFTNNKKQHGIMWSIGISILFTLLQGFIYAVFYSISPLDGLCYFISYILTILIIVLKFKDNLKEDLKNIKQDLKGNILKLLLIHFALIISMYIVNFILYSIIGNVSSNEQGIRSSLFSSPILISISLCILGPITEELTFRYPYKNIKTNRKIAFVVYTLIFASMHIVVSSSLLNLLYIIPYTLLSLSFGYSFYKTNNIIPAIFFHILNNTFTIIILLTLGG